MSYTLPPFAALRAFEATCRLGRQSDAARELGVSVSAISHQIRALEAFLGVALFSRTPGGLTLHPEGELFFKRIGPAFAALSDATSEVIGDADDVPLRVYMHQSIAQMWFIPHLKCFMERQPNQKVSVLTGQDKMAFGENSADAMIIYSEQPPPGEHCDFLFSEVMVPVCSPAYRHLHGPLDTVEAILRQTLVATAALHNEWQIWAEGVGSSVIPCKPHLLFDTRANVLEAASEGIGVALDRSPCGENKKQRGLLIEPLLQPVPTGWSFYFVASERTYFKPRVKKMRAWIIDLCRDLRMKTLD
ncbi:LysR substrate-binding domain-containing protein [Rhodobacteraceae bacterium KMM 6894]|nr:LysR substrate-binding domain-containing protein [Rhodobacteraceae bacterium KMM 6894]